MAGFQTQTLQMFRQVEALRQNGVGSVHAEYAKYYDKWTRCRDVVAGSDAVKMKGTYYLPSLTEQPMTEYVEYVQRANFYNASGRTISGLIGMLFRKPPTAEVPSKVETYLSNIDAAGTPFDMFASIAAREVLSVYRVGVMVDHPDYDQGDDEGDPETFTVAKAEALNLRPTLKMYFTENIINWQHKTINNVHTLTMVVLKECISVPKKNPDQTDNEFEQVDQIQYRVLDLLDGKYRVRVFTRKDGKDEQIEDDKFPMMNDQTLGHIPFYCITPDGISWTLDNPPLLDLVDVNLSHYCTSADYEHGCHFAGVPTPVITGADAPIDDATGKPSKVYLGAKTLLFIPGDHATASYMEFTGSGLTSLVDNLNRKESQMAILGARLLAPEGKQVQTATTTAIHRTGENSILSSISISLSIGLTTALVVFSDWCGVASAACKYTLNRDFLPVTLDGPTLTAMLTSWQAGAISDEEFFDWLQRGDVIEAEVKFEDHKKGDFQDPLAIAKVQAKAAAKPAIPKKASNTKETKGQVKNDPKAA